MWCALGAAAARLLRPSLAPPLKCVVVDCDYTLWHHAVGEVGAEGVVVEPHHLALQARLLALRACGVLLCLCSKNAPQAITYGYNPTPKPTPKPTPTPNPNAGRLGRAESI